MEKFKFILCVPCIYSLKLIYLIWNLHFNITALDKIESKQLPKNREKFVRLSHEYIYLFETRSTFKGERFVLVLRKPISMHLIVIKRNEKKRDKKYSLYIFSEHVQLNEIF